SIFSHCGLDLIKGWLSAISRSLAHDGALVATFLPAEEDCSETGWVYPQCVNYRPSTLERAAADVNLRFEILDWKHPRQTWALFAAPNFDSSWLNNQPLTWNTALERALTAKTADNKAAVTDAKIFATPLKVEDADDCYFYHTMELPGHGVMEGRDWDLRAGVDEYLGQVDFAGQRVLEIGPASGFLTFEMEKRGADVVSVEVTEEHGWDFVPYPPDELEQVFGPRRLVMQQLKNSYWFSHAAHRSNA